MADSGSHHVDTQVFSNKLKDALKGWRQLILILYPLFIWEKNWAPFVLGGFVTTVFLIIWYLETSVLTTLSIVGMIWCAFDYFVPLISENVFDPAKWNESKEAKFAHVCNEMSDGWLSIVDAYRKWHDLKVTSPKMYFAILLSSLIAASWIANIINNLFLTYLFVLFIVLFPGLKQRGILAAYVTLPLKQWIESRKVKVQ